MTIPCLAIKKRTETDSEILDSKATTCIKGVLCLFVMFHNLGLDYKGNSETMELICEHAGGVGVGLFFFLSAFGIIRSYQKNGNKYLLKLIFVHVVKLYIVSVAINLLIYFVFMKGTLETSDLLLRIFNLDVFNNFNRMNRHGWYISTIIGLYIIFIIIYYLCSKLKTDKKFVIAGFTSNSTVVYALLYLSSPS
jgi:peptidoglycan/LPS O-acetylase OafA/YrhL